VLGTATGISWGFMAAVTKEPSSHLGGGPGAVFSAWSLYVLIAAGPVTMLLASHALASGPLAASTHSARPAVRRRPRRHMFPRSRPPSPRALTRSSCPPPTVSAAASATNQNAWIGVHEAAAERNIEDVAGLVVYGNDDPTTATQVTQGLLQQYPNLEGIISPTGVGIAAAAAVLDSPKYRGKVLLTGLGTPNEMRKFVADGTVKSFILWNPANRG
jgi:Periplasmic binding protein domain